MWRAMKILLQIKELGSRQSASLWITTLSLFPEKSGFSHMLNWCTSLPPFCQPREVFPFIPLLNHFSVTAQRCTEDIGVVCSFLLFFVSLLCCLIRWQTTQNSHYRSYLPSLFLHSLWVIKTLTVELQSKENNKYISQIPQGRPFIQELEIS